MTPQTLKRTFGLGALFIYGLGDILGAGIYALIGKVASEAGYWSWGSFVLALGIALLTALSYAELIRRHPHSGGASYFIQVATKNPHAAFVTGWMLLSVSIVSMATLGNAFLGYAQGLGIQWPSFAIIGSFLGILTAINLRGIKQSSIANIICTGIEAAGLLIVLGAGIYFLTRNSSPVEMVPSASEFSIESIIEGAALAFYAFIGFEDLANIADEVKEPKRRLPVAVISSLLVAGLFYVLISWVATATVSPDQLARSSQPLTEVVVQSGIRFPLEIFGGIALFAVANTCLLNFITGSRLLYGMAMQKLISPKFEKVHGRYHTPYFAILCIAPISFLLAISGDLRFLAETTSILILLVFCATNYSLIRLKKIEPQHEGFRVPALIPWLGLATNLGLISFTRSQSLFTALGILLLGVLVSFLLANKFNKIVHGVAGAGATNQDRTSSSDAKSGSDSNT